MSASSASTSSRPNRIRHYPLEQPIQETFLMSIGRHKRTEKYGWLSAFDELAEYLGRIS